MTKALVLALIASVFVSSALAQGALPSVCGAEGCLTCGSATCFQCAEGYYLNVSSPPEGFQGFYRPDRYCSKCAPGCVKCSSFEICEVQGSDAGDIKGCEVASEDGSCAQCSSGYFLYNDVEGAFKRNKNVCAKCYPGCDKCEGPYEPQCIRTPAECGEGCDRCFAEVQFCKRCIRGYTQTSPLGCGRCGGNCEYCTASELEICLTYPFVNGPILGDTTSSSTTMNNNTSTDNTTVMNNTTSTDNTTVMTNTTSTTTSAENTTVVNTTTNATQYPEPSSGFMLTSISAVVLSAVAVLLM